MKFIKTKLAGVFEVEMEPISDERGWFARTFCKREFEEATWVGYEFVQFNHSYNATKGTFRGFHYQIPPHQEAKLIRCVAGGVMDLVIDLRKGSPTFLQNLQVELTAQNNRSILIPAGFAHGFITLTDHAALIYHHTQYFERDADRGVRHDDPRLNLKLPAPIQVISEKDRSYPFLAADFAGLEL